MGNDEVTKPLLISPTLGHVGTPPLLGMRYLFAILIHIGLLCLYGMRINMSVAIVKLVHQYNWSSGEKGFVLSSFYIGYILGQMPGGWVATRFGGKRVFLAGVMATAILTLFVPLAVCSGVMCPDSTNYLTRLQFLRIITGLVESVTYPAFYVMSAQWVPAPERSRLMGIASCGNLMGTAVAFPLCSWLADAYGWEWVFYVFGALGLVWCVAWQLLTASTPAEHSCISHAEKAYIEAHRPTTTKAGKQSVKVPYFQLMKAFVTTPASLALFINHFGCNWGLYLLLNELPSFLTDVYSFDLTSSGLLEAMPYLLMAGVSAVVGLFADAITVKHGRTLARKICQVISSAVPALIFVILGYVPTDAKFLAVAMVIIAVGSSGFYGAGFIPNSLDISPRWSGILYSVSNTFATIPGIVAPLIAGAVVTSKPGTQGEYRIVFYITAALYVVNVITWLLWSTGEVVPALNITVAEVDDDEEATSSTF